MQRSGYEFAPGSRFQAGANLDPQVIGDHIEMLRQQGGGELTPQDVVADARNANSPLHGFFEWDDTKAAEEHRLAQARGLIRAVVITYVQPEKKPIRTRAFVHIAEPGAPHYRSTEQALASAKTREMVLQEAWRELQRWRIRYKDLKELAGVFAVVDDLEKKLPKKGSG